MKRIASIIGGLLLGTTIIASVGVAAVSIIPDDEKLKVEASQIIESKLVPEYQFFDKTTGATTTIPAFVRYKYTDTFKNLPNEIIGKRTKEYLVFSKNGITSYVMDGGVDRYKDAGVWYGAYTATTTPEAFDAQTKISMFYRLLYQTARAQISTTILTSGAGNGNQPWDVPPDWNSANNSLECI